MILRIMRTLALTPAQFELCPDNLVDGIVPDKLSTAVDEYDSNRHHRRRFRQSRVYGVLLHLGLVLATKHLTLYSTYSQEEDEALCFLPDRLNVKLAGASISSRT
jgi:hypothetical protein